MSASQVLFLFSKFSPSCHKLAETIHQHNMSFFTPVNIDDKRSRKTLKKVNIKQLPCIIVVYNSGEKEIFQGQKSHVWVHQVLAKRKAQQDVAVASGGTVNVQREDPVKSTPPPPQQGTTPISSLPIKEDEDQTGSLIRPKSSRSVVEEAKQMAAMREESSTNKGVSRTSIKKRGKKKGSLAIAPHKGLDTGKLDESSEIVFNGDSDESSD